MKFALFANQLLFGITAGPKPARAISVSDIKETSAVASWPVNPDQVDGYEVTASSPSRKQKVFNTSGDTNTVVMDGLRPNENYVVLVRAVKGGVKGSPSPRNFFKTLQTGK